MKYNKYQKPFQNHIPVKWHAIMMKGPTLPSSHGHQHLHSEALQLAMSIDLCFHNHVHVLAYGSTCKPL